MSASVNGVIFWDFDGTLAHRPGMWRGCLLSALATVEPGHAVSEDAIRRGLSDGFPWHAPSIAHLEIRTPEQWWSSLTPVLVRALEGAGARPDLAAAAAQLVPRTYSDPRFWHVYDDTHAALTLLRSNGWRHVVLSNHCPELPALVADLGLGVLIDDVITSAATGYEKPNPAMFQIALDRAPSARTWMVGDNPMVDIDGATAVGIPAILVRDQPGHGLQWAAHRILNTH
jgi:putative hydrolase of the HAD superfamily